MSRSRFMRFVTADLKERMMVGIEPSTGCWKGSILVYCKGTTRYAPAGMTIIPCTWLGITTKASS
jgi:hypothetical protein